MCHKISLDCKVLFIPGWLEDLLHENVGKPATLQRKDILSFDNMLLQLTEEDLYLLYATNQALYRLALPDGTVLFQDFTLLYDSKPSTVQADWEEAYEAWYNKHRNKLNDDFDALNPKHIDFTCLGLYDMVEYDPDENILYFIDGERSGERYSEVNETNERFPALMKDALAALMPFHRYDTITGLGIFKAYAKEGGDVGRYVENLYYNKYD